MALAEYVEIRLFDAERGIAVSCRVAREAAADLSSKQAKIVSAASRKYDAGETEGGVLVITSSDLKE